MYNGFKGVNEQVMEIKRTLKNFDIRISKLASELGVSRPTLDTYIEYYESGKSIPNSRYQAIFDYLFSTESTSTIEFARKFDYVKRTYLQGNRDEATQEHCQKLNDLISDRVSAQETDEDILELVNLFLSSDKVPLVKAISRYFTFVNGLHIYNEKKEDEKDRALFSQLFKIFSDYQADKIQLDATSYQAFIEKSKRVSSKKGADQVTAELLEYIRSRIPEGSSIDLEYIKKILEKKED